jgi:hypothetical protein
MGGAGLTVDGFCYPLSRLSTGNLAVTVDKSHSQIVT